jgi:hypothetical protein
MLACRPWLVVAFAAAVFAGCGPQVLRYPVEGVVTLDGDPVKGASVTFMPRTTGRPGIAETDAEGRFSLQELGMHHGIAPGQYGVAVFFAVLSDPKASREQPGAEAGVSHSEKIEAIRKRPPIRKYIVPERYSTAETSGLTYQIDGPTKGITVALTTTK